jgi:hypothetical protein
MRTAAENVQAVKSAHAKHAEAAKHLEKAESELADLALAKIPTIKAALAIAGAAAQAKGGKMPDQSQLYELQAEAEARYGALAVLKSAAATAARELREAERAEVMARLSEKAGEISGAMNLAAAKLLVALENWTAATGYAWNGSEFAGLVRHGQNLGVQIDLGNEQRGTIRALALAPLAALVAEAGESVGGAEDQVKERVALAAISPALISAARSLAAN